MKRRLSGDALREESAFSRNFLHGLIPLTAMQLKEKSDFSFLKTKKTAITKIVFTILGFVAATLLCFVFFFLAKILKIFSLAGTIPVAVLSIVYAFMFILSVMSCTAGLVKTLYFARDNHMLLTLPVRADHLYISKLLVFYLYELKRNTTFIIPLFLAYGIVTSVPFAYYPWMLLMFLFVSMAPVLLGALLSIPAMWIYKQLLQHRWLQLILYAVVIGAAVWGVSSLILLIPENLDLIAQWEKVSARFQEAIIWFEGTFRLLYRLTVLISGKVINLKYTVIIAGQTGHDFLILFGVLAGMFLLGFFLARPLFFRMASSPFEYRKRSDSEGRPNHVLPGWLSAAKKELLLSSRTTDEIFTNVVELFGLPLMILLLNRLFAAMNVRAFGEQLIFVCNFLIMLLFMLSSNVMMSSVYSREGRLAYFNKVPPTRFWGILLSKLYVRLLVTALTAAATAVVYFRSCSIATPKTALMTGLMLFFFSSAHLFWSAEMDIMNPQYEQYGAMGTHSHNPNETLSGVWAMIIPLLATVLFFLLQRDDDLFHHEGAVWIKMTVGGALLCFFKIWTYLRKVSLYYKEK